MKTIWKAVLPLSLAVVLAACGSNGAEENAEGEHAEAGEEAGHADDLV